MARVRLALAVAGALAWGAAQAQAVPDLPVVPPAATQTLYLDLVLDGRVVRALVPARVEDGRVWIAPDELRQAGLLVPPGLPADADGRVPLDAVQGLDARFDPATQQVLLAPSLALRPLQQLGYATPPAVEVQRDHGLRLDWDAYARGTGGAHSLAVGTALRWFGPWGTLETTGVSRAGDGEDADTRAYERLDSRWTYSDPARLTTWTVGDLVSGGLAWTRPVRMGGVQWRRNFGTRPDLIVYPLPRFAASATVPSSVELFVDNVRQSQQDVGAGPFVITDFPRVVGAGQAVVVVTDALGRTSQTTVPLYVDYQRLAPGLSDFSLEAGVLRTGFGAAGDYDDAPVASGSLRRGLTDTFTAELHGEAGPGLRLAGAGLAWAPGNRFGVVSAAVAASRGDGDGALASLGYQWFGPRVGVDASVQRADAGYRDLGSLGEGRAPLRRQERATAWWRIPRGSLSATWLRARDADLRPTRVLGVGLSQTWGPVAVSANAFDDARAGLGLTVAVSIPLGREIDTSFTIERDRDDTRIGAGLRRTAPYAGGFGWNLQARDDGDGLASATWRGRAGEVTAGVDRSGGRDGSFAQGYGSLVWMDGRAFASRRIGDSFAVVSTAGVPDVPILYENRVAGRTDADGYLLLSDLRGWQRNRLAIDPDALAADLRVPSVERLVTPADNAGVRVAFDLVRIRSATVPLREADGTPAAAGTRIVRSDGSGAIVGFDGELWLEQYTDGDTLRWTRKGVPCTVVLPALPAGADRIPALTCVPGTPP